MGGGHFNCLSLSRIALYALFGAAMFVPRFAGAVPAHPDLFEDVQPDGTRIGIRLRGDKWHHWHEDESGYTVVREEKSKSWVYAALDATGTLQPTELRVGRDVPPKSLSKGLRSRVALERAKRLKAEEKASNAPQKVLTKGTLRNLVVLVQFPDLSFRYQVSDFEKLYNEEGYSVDGAYGSVKDYYKEVSYSQLNLESVIVGPITVSHGFAYYGENASDSSAVKDMVAEALRKLDSQGFDFSQCDMDGDGEIDGIDIIHAGYGAEYGGNSQDYIWSHKWSLRSAVYYDGVRIYNYHTEAEIDGWESKPSSNKITPIGVICHETGHFLGLPDLYDTDYSSSGVGSFCLMANGSWNGGGMRPAHMSAWCKVKLGWVSPTEITVSGGYSLPQVEFNKSIFKLHGNFASEKEYFLLENRQGVGFDADLPGNHRGILIWHIDDSRSNNSDETHYWVDLEEASGVQHLQQGNSVEGDDADYWRSTTQSSFSATSNPGTESYTGGALGISLLDISDSRETMQFYVSTSIDSDISLGTALDNQSLNFTSGGDASWFGQTSVFSSGSSSAQSGVIADSKSSWLQTSVTGPGTLSFKWKVSSEEGCDVLRLVIDGSSAAMISGETGWMSFTTNLTLGVHTIRWSYIKDYSASVGSDCGWVDQVQWTETSGDDDSAHVSMPQAGGSVTSSSIMLSSATVYNKREIPNWITSVSLNIGTSSMLLWGGGIPFGSLQIGATGNATYTVQAKENDGPERTWIWNIRSPYGDILHTLVVTQAGSNEGGSDELPDLVICQADGWPYGLYLSGECESLEAEDEFTVGSAIYLNSCFCNIGSVASEAPFAVLHEILDLEDNVVASWRYDHDKPMACGSPLYWFGASWDVLSKLSAGLYTLRCTLDPDDSVKEEDESNNTAEYYFEVLGIEEVTVTFDANGGTVPTDSQTYTVGGRYGSLPVAEYAAHSFAGWYTARTGGRRIVESDIVSPNVTVLYARWEDAALPDLTIGLSASKTTVSAEEELAITYSVRNLGLAPAEGVSCRVRLRYADSSQIETLWEGDIGTVQAGGSSIGTVNIPAGKYTGTVEISALVSGETGESDLLNNSAQPISVTFLPKSSDADVVYGPFGTEDSVVCDAVAPTLIVNASVKVRGEPAARNDCVAAYRMDTGELCGLGKVLGDDGIMSMVMNINAGIGVHFKLWTSLSGLENPEILDCDTVSDLVTPLPGTFLTGRTLSFASKMECRIELAAARWHQVSFNVMPADASPEAVFGEVSDKIGYVTSGSKFWSPVYGGTLASIAVGAGYWIQTTSPDVTFAVSGTPDPSISIPLKTGWNLIGYTPVVSAPVAKALASAFSSGSISFVCYGSGIYPGTLTTMHPGYGYWVYAERAGAISYDAAFASVPSCNPERSSSGTAYGPFGSEDDIIGGDAVAPTVLKDAQAIVNGLPAEDGDCMAAYRTDNGRLCGLARVAGGDGRFSMVVYLNAGTSVQFKIWRASSGMESPVILEAKNAWVVPAPGGAPLTDVAIEVVDDDDTYNEPDLYEAPWPGEQEGLSMSSARTYDGMIFEGGALVGTIRVKTTQAVKQSGKMTSTVSATVKTAAKTYTYSGATTKTGVSISNWKKKTSKAPSLVVSLGRDGMYGEFGELAEITGARYVESRFAPYQGVWTTRLVDVDGRVGHITFSVNAKGSAAISGFYPDGKKVVGKTQLVAGENSAWIPWVVNTPTGGNMHLVIRIMDNDVSVWEDQFGGGGIEFQTNDCAINLMSEDGWEIESSWFPKDAQVRSVPIVRTQPPVINKAEIIDMTTNYMGVAYSEVITINDTGYPARFTASRLPTGLSINATTGRISGIPVREGVFVSTIKVKSAADGKLSDTVSKTFVIKKLPTWATGTFNGSGMLSDAETEGEYGDSAIFKLSVSSAGKLSGKVQFRGLVYTLAASSFEEFAFGDMSGRFTATAKSGSKSYVAEIMIGAPYEDGGMPEVGGIVSIGDCVVDFWGYKSMWGASDYKTFAKAKLKGKTLTLKGEEFGLDSGEKLTLSFDASGNVKIAGTFVNSKKVKYSVSASAPLCASELYFDEEEGWGFSGDIFIYFPAKSSKKFKGFFRQVAIWYAEDLGIQAY